MGDLIVNNRWIFLFLSAPIGVKSIPLGEQLHFPIDKFLV